MLFTFIQNRILRHIDRAGGQTRSLMKLTEALDINYSNAYWRIRDLEHRGVLKVELEGRELVMTINNPLEWSK